jgi:hypothetical protein
MLSRSVLKRTHATTLFAQIRTRAPTDRCPQTITHCTAASTDLRQSAAMTRGRLVGIAIGLALALASVSIEGGRTLHVVDMNGAPVPGVWVAYHHEGTRPNPAHSTTYQATGRSLIQGDSAGEVDIPQSVHVHWPFPIETRPELRVDLVYAPDLHNGLATIGDRAIARTGAAVAGDLANVRLADLSSDPERWEGTLMNVSLIIGGLISERTLRPHVAKRHERRRR